MGEAKRRKALNIVVSPEVVKDMGGDVAAAIGMVCTGHANALVVEAKGRIVREIIAGIRLVHCPVAVSNPHDMSVVQTIMINADFIGDEALTALTTEFAKRGLTWYMKPKSDATA